MTDETRDDVEGHMHLKGATDGPESDDDVEAHSKIRPGPAF
jgi:hypothetical protein